MSDDTEHKCHCSHVVVIQTKVTIAQWLIGIAGAAAIGALITSVGNLFSLHIRTDPPPASSAERTFPDRVGH